MRFQEARNIILLERSDDNMKRAYACLMLLLMLIGVAGCSTTTNLQNENYLLDEKFDTEAYLPGYDMQNSYARYKVACETEEAYYFKPDQDVFLYFYDKESGLSGKLCGRPECPHDSPACNAYLDVRFGISYYDGKIYFVKSENARLALYAMDTDGNQLQKVQELKSDMNGINPLVRIHRGYIYTAVVKSEVNEGKDMYRLIVQQEVLGQEEGETVIVYQESVSSAEFGLDFYLQAQGNTLYLLVNKQNASSLQTEFSLHAYDSRTRHQEEVVQGMYQGKFTSDFILEDHKGYIALYTIEDDGKYYVQEIDIPGKRLSELTEISTGDPMLSLGLQEGVVIGYQGAGEPSYYLTDWEGNLLRQGDLPLLEGQTEVYVSVMGNLDDGVLFLLSTYQEESIAEALLLVPLDPAEEPETLWQGTAYLR